MMQLFLSLSGLRNVLDKGKKVLSQIFRIVSGVVVGVDTNNCVKKLFGMEVLLRLRGPGLSGRKTACFPSRLLKGRWRKRETRIL